MSPHSWVFRKPFRHRNTPHREFRTSSHLFRKGVPRTVPLNPRYPEQGKGIGHFWFGRHIDVFISYSHASDEALAPALQRGMSLLGKKWNQPQVLRVYRDDTNLSASTDVTAEIYRAVDEARYFLLLASPAAAQSDWVAKEIARWRLEDPQAHRFLIAVTDGTATWDSAAKDFTGLPRTRCPAACPDISRRNRIG
jgi:hypothetical protein